MPTNVYGLSTRVFSFGTFLLKGKKNYQLVIVEYYHLADTERIAKNIPWQVEYYHLSTSTTSWSSAMTKEKF